MGLGVKSKLKYYKGLLKGELAKKGVFLNANDRKLQQIKGKHKGKPAVVIGMGPSLQPSDLERFKGFVSFSCNKIYLGYEQTDWRPDYYSVIDTTVIQNNKDEIRDLKGSQKVFPHKIKNYLPKMDDALYYSTNCYINDKQFKSHARYFDDPVCGTVGGGASVVFSMLQLAYWAECDPVYVVGIDFSFQVNKVSDEKSDSGEKIIVNSNEKNHFHPNYRKKGEKWTYPKLDKQKEAFAYANKAFKNANRTLLNASRKTELKELDRVDFDSVFKPSD